MKLLVTGDWHLTEGRRFDQTLMSLWEVLRVGKREKVDVWCLTGDFTGTTVPHRQTPKERNAILSIVAEMLETAPVRVLYGNHDYPGDLDYLRYVSKKVIVADAPSIDRELSIAMVPYIWRTNQAESIAQGNANESASVLAWLAENAVHCHSLIGHFNVAGSKTAGGEVLRDREVEFSVDQLNSLGMSFVGLGHIHTRQKLGSNIYYAGSPDRSNFGEGDIKGFLIADVKPSGASVEYYDTDAQRFVTFDVELTADGAKFSDVPTAEKCKNAEVRFRLNYDEGAAGVEQARKFLLATAESLGASVAKVESCPRPRQSQRSSTITKMRSEPEKFREWVSQVKPAPPKKVVDSAAGMLEELDREFA